MKTRITLLVIGTLILFGCSQHHPKITIEDVEKIGFEKGDQQLYQLVNAEDGWGGVFKGETVELYQFSSTKTVNAEYFLPIKNDNISGWQDGCVVRNLLLISKGKLACPELRKLD